MSVIVLVFNIPLTVEIHIGCVGVLRPFVASMHLCCLICDFVIPSLQSITSKLVTCTFINSSLSM